MKPELKDIWRLLTSDCRAAEAVRLIGMAAAYGLLVYLFLVAGCGEEAVVLTLPAKLETQSVSQPPPDPNEVFWGDMWRLNNLAVSWGSQYQRVRIRYVADPNCFTITKVGGPSHHSCTTMPLPGDRWAFEFAFYSRWGTNMKDFAELSRSWKLLKEEK